jgi:hypothetical protein
MSATTTTIQVEQAGNGTKVAFDFAFKILAATDLVVRKKSALGVYTAALTLNADYTVAFDSAAQTGTVTYTVAPVSGGASNILRASDLTQASVLPVEGTMPAKTVETMSDKLALAIQELKAGLALAPAFAPVPMSRPALYVDTPSDTKGLKWQLNGDGSYMIINTVLDPDVSQAAAAASAVAAAASAASAAAALASATALVAALVPSGLYAARPVAPTLGTYYYSTDRDSLELWVPIAGRWFLLG